MYNNGCEVMLVLVSMKSLVYDELDDEALGWACIKPTILQIRGKDPTVKWEA